jgi:hypothetical protein
MRSPVFRMPRHRFTWRCMDHLGILAVNLPRTLKHSLAKSRPGVSEVKLSNKSVVIPIRFTEPLARPSKSHVVHTSIVCDRPAEYKHLP